MTRTVHNPGALGRFHDFVAEAKLSFDLAPNGFFRNELSYFIEVLECTDADLLIDEPEVRTIIDMIHHYTSTDMYSGIKAREPVALEGLMHLKSAIGFLHHAMHPVRGVYEHILAFNPGC